jgi:hypothetical protein
MRVRELMFPDENFGEIPIISDGSISAEMGVLPRGAKSIAGEA